MAVLLGGLPVSGPVWGDEVPTCWYPPKAEIGCSSKSHKKADGTEKIGIYAKFARPTNRYGHSVLGDTPEWGALTFWVNIGPNHGPLHFAQINLPENRVFEDIAPRFANFDNDEWPEIVVVESHFEKGARLAIYGADSENNQTRLKAATPHIGTRYRWLAPIGVADFNGDGDMDVAYVDRPHLAKTLRVWTYRNGGLEEIATLAGVTNHSIGEPFITSAIRTCDGRPQMILNDARRRNIVAVYFEGGALVSKVIGRYGDSAQVITPPKC